jgi:hypothetical protein
MIFILNSAIMKQRFLRSGQKTKPHFPVLGTWGFAHVLFGAFVSHASWI